MSSIQFFLSVCDDKPEVEMGGTKYKAGFRGEVKVQHSVKDDILSFDLSECGHKPSVGKASRIKSVSIRVCAKSVTSIAIYDDPAMNAMGCCHCCSNGCCVYGHSDCSCGI